MTNDPPSLLPSWAEPAPRMGQGVYQLTRGPREHKHTYHLFCPWSIDGTELLLFRYDRENPEGEVCLLDLVTQDMRVLGRTPRWTTHSAAMEQWQGNRPRVLYNGQDERGSKLVSVGRDGSDARCFYSDAGSLRCSRDGKYVFAGSPFEELFPNDEIAPRHDKGLLRLDVDSGEWRCIASIEDALSLNPRRDAIRDYHLYIKMMIPHPVHDRVLFHLVNGIWDRGLGEERSRSIYTVGFDGSDLTYIGNCLHHPNWHPVENTILLNVKDFNDVVRFGLYDGDGKGLLEYVPGFVGSGHPSHRPDGKVICTDRGEAREGRSFGSVVICDPVTGIEYKLAEYEPVSGGYVIYKAVAERPAGATVIETLVKSRGREYETWQTQAHPAWSRDGRLVLFNADEGRGSQLFVVDVAEAIGEDHILGQAKGHE